MTALREAFVVDAVRTPIARYKGALASVRTDDLAAHGFRHVEVLRDDDGDVRGIEARLV